MNRRFLLAILLGSLWIFITKADDEGSEYVRQVLEDDADTHHNYDNADDSDVEQMNQEKIALQNEAQEQRKKEEERIKAEEENYRKEAAEKRQREMDEQFEREIARMSEQQQKEARKQKKRDSAVVKRILKAEKKRSWYKVLGIRQGWSIPSRTLRLGKFSVRIPGFQTLPPIKTAYRAVSKTVHPDKNRDARASEAFLAVEKATEILSDEDQRTEYDAWRRAENAKLRDGVVAVVQTCTDRAIQVTLRAIRVFRKVLGPFAFPVFLIGIIII